MLKRNLTSGWWYCHAEQQVDKERYLECDLHLHPVTLFSTNFLPAWLLNWSCVPISCVLCSYLLLSCLQTVWCRCFPCLVQQFSHVLNARWWRCVQTSQDTLCWFGHLNLSTDLLCCAPMWCAIFLWFCGGLVEIDWQFHCLLLFVHSLICAGRCSKCSKTEQKKNMIVTEVCVCFFSRESW